MGEMDSVNAHQPVETCMGSQADHQVNEPKSDWLISLALSLEQSQDLSCISAEELTSLLG